MLLTQNSIIPPQKAGELQLVKLNNCYNWFLCDKNKGSMTFIFFAFYLI